MRKNLNRSLILLLLLIVATSAGAQSTAMKNLRDQDQHYSIRFQYIYESMIRAGMNLMADTNASEIVEGLRLIVVYSVEKESEFYSPEMVSEFRKDLTTEGFELLMEMEREGTDIEILKKGRGSNVSHVVLLSSDSTSFKAVDVTGDIDIQKMMSMGPKKLNEILEFL